MIITYIGHSGFSVALEENLLVFDYYTGEAPSSEEMARYKDVFVFVSHAHYDHFNPAIFGWREAANVHYMLSFDVEAKGAARHFRVGDDFMENGLRARAYGSTDEGVSWLVEVEGKRIFHAGDLNWWHWRQESTPEEIEEADKDFFGVMEPLKGSRADVAFFPVDPRVGKDYDAGAHYFCKETQPRVFIPMHFWNQPEAAASFKAEEDCADTRVIPMTAPGQSVEI